MNKSNSVEKKFQLGRNLLNLIWISVSKHNVKFPVLVNLRTKHLYISDWVTLFKIIQCEQFDNGEYCCHSFIKIHIQHTLASTGDGKTTTNKMSSPIVDTWSSSKGHCIGILNVCTDTRVHTHKLISRESINSYNQFGITHRHGIHSTDFVD